MEAESYVDDGVNVGCRNTLSLQLQDDGEEAQ